MNIEPTRRVNGAAGPISFPSHIEAPESRHRLLWLHDSFKVETQHFLVHNLIEPETLVVMFGEANCGKSTVAVDLGMHIAQGSSWRDRDTTKGLVLHVAGEGVRGVRMRQAAWIEHHDAPRTLPYAVLPTAVDLSAAGAVRQMVTTVLEAAAGIGEAPGLVIVDTLARCLMGDENTSLDMGRFIAGCDTIRTETKATILVIHHAGKDLTRGARGHSSLRAAADTELLIEGHMNPRSLSVKKQRDLELGDPMGFRLEPVTIGRHPETNETITAVVVAHDEAVPMRRQKATGKHQQTAIVALREYTRQHNDGHITSEAITGLLRAQSVPRQRRPEVLSYLVSVGVLTPAVAGYTLNASMLP